MQENSYNVTTRENENEIWPSGIANVVIPKGFDRQKYISECFRTSTVSIYSEHNGFSNRVPIDMYSLNFIEFPLKHEQFGSKVSFKVDPIQKRPIVDGIYYSNSELCDLVENQFKFKRYLNGNMVEFVGSPKGKYLGLNVVSVDEGGEVFINVKSKDESGKVNINVEGECNLTSLTDTTIKQYGKLQFVTINRGDENEFTLVEQTSTGRNITSKEEDIITERFRINDGKENFVLGQVFKKYLRAFIEEVSNATVTTTMGQMPLINKLAIQEYAKDEKIDDFLSTVGFIDK